MDYIKILKFLAPYLIGAAIAGFIVGWAQQVRVKHVKADLAKVQGELKETKRELTACQDANAANKATIITLTQEVKDAMNGCDSRLAVKDRTLKNLKRISELTPGTPPGKGAQNEKITGTLPSTGDAILDGLNRMFYPGTSADSKN